MVELHANVAHMRNHPATKQVATNRGTEVVLAQMKVEAIRTMQHTVRLIRLE